jgi:hypothetical protein
MAKMHCGLAREALVLGVTKSPPILAVFAVAEDIVIKHSLVATMHLEVVLRTRYRRRMEYTQWNVRLIDSIGG